MSRILSVAALSVVLGASGLAQTTFATLTGSVTDPNGSAITGVTLEAVHLGSNYRYTTKSNEVGIYTIGQLREGVYKLRATIPGFKEAVIQDIQLVALDVRRLDVRLEIGAVEAKVEVA